MAWIKLKLFMEPMATLKFGAQGTYRPTLAQSPQPFAETFELGSEIVLLGGFAGGETHHKLGALR